MTKTSSWWKEKKKKTLPFGHLEKIWLTKKIRKCHFQQRKGWKMDYLGSPKLVVFALHKVGAPQIRISNLWVLHIQSQDPRIPCISSGSRMVKQDKMNKQNRRHYQVEKVKKVKQEFLTINEEWNKKSIGIHQWLLCECVPLHVHDFSLWKWMCSTNFTHVLLCQVMEIIIIKTAKVVTITSCILQIGNAFSALNVSKATSTPATWPCQITSWKLN